MTYDGTAYHGYQRQVASQPTIQGEIEHVLATICQRPVTVTGAGRTDSGVHATGQVIAFDLEWRHSSGTLQQALNAQLPPDIGIRQLTATVDSFHPRFDARRRSYRYTILNSAEKQPLQRLYAWQWRDRLDEQAMAQAASHLIGEHDFATFGQPPQGTNTVRHLFKATCIRNDDRLFIDLTGNAFLYRMVRSIVGALVAVGSGKWDEATFVTAFEAADRHRAAATAPPHGLVFTGVVYDDADSERNDEDLSNKSS